MSFIGKTLGKIVGHQSKTQSQLTNNSPNSSQNSQSLSHQNSLSSNLIHTNSSHSSHSSTLSSTNTRQQQLSNDSQLTLTHLRKVFYEYLHPKNHDLNQSERDDKLYNILPLFIKAFGHSSLMDINDKFGDAEQFCIACTKLLVNEITKRVHDDLVLVKFFEIKTSEDATDGSGLLNTVNLLASGPPFLIELMTKFSLPSRLVMCVYLFICLPEPKDSLLDLCEFNARERRILFQKCFHQLLTKLCQNSCTCDELVEADSLKLLFKIVSSTCEQHNIPWRQTAADALLTITKNLNLKAMHYLSNSQSIQMCLKCMEHGEICSSNLIERTELLITILTFLRETSFLSQVLLEDFRISSGYKIITDIATRLEKENKDECRTELRNLFFCLEEFCSAGFNDLKLNNSNISMFKIEGFQVPQPLGKGRTVRNPLSFQTIITIFNKAQTLELCTLVLNTIRNIYNKDHCNYFLLESQNVLLYSMDETSIKIHTRNNDIQLKFIELLDFIVFDLKFVPCKELVSIGLSIQNYNCTKWSINSANFLFKLIKTNQVYKDAFRELGLLEILVSCLHKFAVLLKEKQVDKEIHIDAHQKELGFLIMDMICSLISHNNSNAKIFRELGGARLAHNMVPYKLCRSQALNIVSTLLLTTAGEDDMSTLLGLMHTAIMEDLELKNAVLRSLLHILRESHRTRTVFRKAGGFVYLVSVLISMEGCLSLELKSPWDNVNKNEIFKTIKTILNALAVSMRYEPANAKFFETEVKWSSLCSALKLLGCFDTTKTQFEPRTNSDFVKRGFDVFETYFCNLEEDCIQTSKTTNQNSNSQNTMDDDRLIFFCHIMRYLYDTAIDTFDKQDFYVDFNDGFEDRPFNRHANKQFINQPGSQDSYLKTTNTSLNSNSIKKSNSFINNLTNPIDEPLIVHPGAISSILHLLTAVSSDKNEHMASRLQYQMINLIKNLLRFERNQQLMSNANFIDDIIFTCKHVLNDETHFLNASIQHIFERLATQSIKPKSLREYLRSGTVFDLTTVNPDKNILIPLNRVKCLISMTTPRDSRQHIGTSFVEFNMFVEGFGCLFLPSIAPQLINAPSIVAMGMVSVGNDLSVNGGIGSGERVFPSQSGISYSTWICVDKFGKSSSFSDKSLNNKIHPIRILTLLKHSKIKDTLTSCLSIYLSPKNRSLFVSTEENLLQQQNLNESNIDENIKLNENLVKFNCSELFQEGQWLHLVLVFSRAVLKNSSVSLYVNSNLIGTQKLHYINSILTTNTTPASVSIHGVIGTLPQYRVQSPVIWRQASCYLFEEIIQPNIIQNLYKLGPNYLGSFQSPNFETNLLENTSSNLLTTGSLIPDEKIVFGLHSQNIFEMTLAKFRRVYNKNDSKVIGKLLNLPSNECVTPLRIISNTAAQLNGSARSVGGVILGYLGVRTFQPMPVSKSIEHIGGVQFLLGLIAMANDIEFMYASVKALVCICKSNFEISREMDRLNGYQLLAMLYKRKKSLINSHILNLTFSLVISDDNGKEQAIVSNVKAFEYLLCDLEIWYDTPSEILRSLHERFNDLLNDQITNAKLFNRLNMLKRFLFMIKEANSNTLNENTLKYVISTIRILIMETIQSEDLIKFGQYLISLLPDNNINEKYANLDSELSNQNTFDSETSHNPPPNSASTFTLTSSNNIDISLSYSIKLRNKLLSIIDDIISKQGCTKSITFQEEFQRLLGYDWFLLFMQSNVHKTTLIKSCKMLFTLLLNAQNLYKFKDSSYCGGWLNNIFNQLRPSNNASTTTNSNNNVSTPTTNCTPMTPIASNTNNSTPTSSITTPTNPSISIKNTLMNSSVTSINSASDNTSYQTIQSQSSIISSSNSVDINIDVCQVPGFQLMQIYFSKNPDVVELYYLLFALLFDAQRIKELPQNADLNLNSICKYVFDKSFDSEHTLFCKINKDVSLDITIILLSMIRSLMNPCSTIKMSPESKDYAIILLQIFRFMYHNCDEFRTMASNLDFLSSLILTLYPYNELTQQEINEPTPVEIKPFAEAICNQDIDGKSYHSYLSIHPARKLVMDFLRDLLYDGIINLNQNINSSIQSYANYYYGTKQGQQVIDQILLSLPDNSTNLKRNQEFITELFKTILDYLLSSDIFNEQPHLPQLNTNLNFVLQNFFTLIDRLVDKLWDEMYRRESKEVFELITKFMNNLKKKPYNYSNENLINSMNRCLLYQLSRPCETLNEQIGMLDVLHKMSQLKSLIFSSNNSQSDFFGCLTHCLLMITSSEEISHMDLVSPNTMEDLNKRFQSKTLWYANPNFNEKLVSNIQLSFDSITTVNNNDNNNDKAAKYLLVSAAQRVWLELYLNKKTNLEECLKVSLNSIGKNPTLDELRPILTEPARKVFISFIEGEKKLPERIQSQLQAKFQRVTDGITTITGGFSRVVSLKKQKKETARLSQKELNESVNSIQANTMSLKDFIDTEYRKFFRSNEQRHNYLYSEWLNIEKDLLRERALWGIDKEDKLNKWKLDLTEGPNRQRKRLLPNTVEFYKHYQYKPTIDFLKPNKKYKIPSSFDSKEYYNSFKVQSLLHHQQNLLDKLATDREHQQMILQHQLEQQQQLNDDYEPPSESLTFENNQTNEDTNNEEAVSPTISNQTYVAQSTHSSNTSSSYNQNITRLLEEGEKINHIYRCARVQGLDTTEGVFLFGKEHFYVLDGFTLVSTKDIVDIDSLKSSAYEPLIPRSSGGGTKKIAEKQCSKFAYEDIREVHNRRYLLQEIAMEIFSNDGRNYLLVFPRKCRNKVYERLISLTPDMNDSAQQSIAGQRRSINIEQNTSILNALIGEKSVVQRWERGEITNFQYLMFLNTLAGRSYNDLMQYPVFPWILADYDSDELDLNKSITFRDLSKPMGAQTQERLKQFEKRFSEWEDPTGETPPYFYGTHYSSAMIVASYLLRLEPFTQIFLRLQGGHFDLADRLFHSVKDNWLSASKNNMADVKELIPEFFYLPEFLVNSNKFDLGKKQSGIVLNDVVLPPWAKNDHREFIRVHRMALESDYVSAHLNEWIDLIFGFKQQGQSAIDSCNVFHHLFYEGAVNIDEIDDPLKRSAIIGFINNFGQIPKQLFKKPHPTKKLNTQFLYGLAGNIVNTTLGNTAVNLVNHQTSDLSSNSSSSSLPISFQSNSTQQIVFIHYLKNLKPSLQPVRELKSQIGQIIPTDKGILVAEQNKFLMPPKYDRYVAWGYSDESIKIGYTDYEKSFITFENIQDGAIFCCCSPDSKIIITAGTNTVVNVWELSKLKQRRIQLKTRLFGHQDTVTCMAVSNGYHMLVTGSRDHSCIIWDINKWAFVRQLPNHYGAVSCLSINELTGDIVTASSTFVYYWNINGELLATVNAIPTSRTHLVLCVYMSQVNEWDDRNVILTGGTDGIVRMWSLSYNQVPENQIEDQNLHDFDTISNKTMTSADEFDSNNKSNSITTSCIENSSSGITSPNTLDLNKKDIDSNIIADNFFPESFSHNLALKEEEKQPCQENITFTTNENESDSETTSLIQDKNEINNNNNSEIKNDEDFVMVDRNQFSNNNELNISNLKPGHIWKKELIFRNKLTMHTSYDRTDNSEPASVTCISISKDNKIVYVGDSRGRVFSWVCNENPGKSRADHWIKDDLIEKCKVCNIKFSFSERKHHCRNCGGIFCNNCSKFEIDIPRLHIFKPVRVCQTCYNQIKAAAEQEELNQTSVSTPSSTN